MGTVQAARIEPSQHVPGRTDDQVELESADCPLCGGSDFSTVVVGSDPTTGIGGNFRVVRCRNCQLAITNPRPTVNSIGMFYPDSYGPYVGRDGEENWTRRLRRGLQRAVLRHEFRYPPQPTGRATALLSTVSRLWNRRSRRRQSWIPYRAPGRLLDFGCGAGEFLRQMRDVGWSVQGLDMSAKVAEQVRQRMGIPVHVGTLPHPEIGAESFDAITMWNSLEHVHNPREVVACAAKALRSGGILVVGVPNFDSWSFEKFQHEWYGLELPRHLTHFTPDTLSRLVAGEGFRLLGMQQIARVGCLRKSARRAARSGWGGWRLALLRWKPVGLTVADWTERIGRADFMRLTAEKM